VWALELAAEVYFKQDDLALAIDAFDALLALPSAPVEEIARALVNRGATHGRLGDSDKAIADYCAAIALSQVPVEWKARALVNRGAAYGRLGYSDKAIADFNAVIDLPHAPVEQIAAAFFNRGMTYWQSSDAEQSQRDLEAITRLEGAPLERRVDAHLALAELHVATGRWGVAMTALGDGLRGGTNAAPSYRGDSTGIIRTFFDSSLQPAIRRERIRDLVQVYGDAIPQLGEALTRHLGRLRADAEKLPSPDNLETWAAAWEDAGEGIHAFRLALRIFRTGVDFLKAGGTDRGVLLDLNQEERTLLAQVFALESEPGTEES
jgi:tetratricopeptide (TPR) repeat protein